MKHPTNKRDSTDPSVATKEVRITRDRSNRVAGPGEIRLFKD